jgi:hypothetical protein
MRITRVLTLDSKGSNELASKDRRKMPSQTLLWEHDSLTAVKEIPVTANSRKSCPACPDGQLPARQGTQIL